MFEYADDPNLLVPEHADVQLYDELKSILQWTFSKRMVINIAKTKEIVFVALILQDWCRPSKIASYIDGFAEAKLLGVFLQ